MIVFDSPDWLIDRITVGDLMVNCYIVQWKTSGEAIIVDPGDEGGRINRRVKELGAKVTEIVLTHGHGDHIGGIAEVQQATWAKVAVGRKDAVMLTDAWANLSAPFGMDVTAPAAERLLDEGDEIVVGEGRLKVFETPGHSAGSIILANRQPSAVDGLPEKSFAIVGDLIFQGSIGRTDFPGGNFETLISMIREKVFPLDDDCLLLPGHGDATTVGQERKYNPFLI